MWEQNVQILDPTTSIFEIIDHTNVFLLTEVVSQFNDEAWRSKVLMLYFKKLCTRILQSPETQEFDLRVMKNWIAECPNQS